MKHIILFSGGANSSYAAWLVAQIFNKNDIVLLHTPTYSEHPDADRFRKQVADYIGLPITVQADGRSVWDLIKSHHCLPSDFIPFCSDELKTKQAEKYYKTISGDFTVYLGYGINEPNRVQVNYARYQNKGIKSEYPIISTMISDQEVKEQIKNEWKICLPEPYKYLSHNNCLPCFKGGQKHFKQVWKYYPEYFAKAVEAEKQIGHTVFKDISLTKLSEQWEMQPELISDEDYDMRPCMCAI